jgi:hypothetical protein
MPEVLELLKGGAFHALGASARGASVRKTGVLRESGLPVALVDVGSGYGAMNNGLAVFAVVRGKVIAPAFQFGPGVVERGGTVLAVGASAMHAEWVEIDAADGAIVAKTIYRADGGTRIASCEMKAYRWDGSREMFVYDRTLGLRLHGAGCAEPKSGE